MAADSFDKRRIAAEESRAASDRERDRERASATVAVAAAGSRMLPIIELCKCSPGMVTAMGVSVGLTAGRDHVEGHDRAEEALGPRHRSRMDKIGAWAITEPNSGSGRVRVDGGDRPPRRRRVRAERFEDVHHQRSVRRHDRVHLQARRRQRARRPQGRAVRARHGHARPRAVEAVAQDGSALVADRHVVPRRRARRPRPPARRERRGVRRRRGPRGVEGDVRDGAFGCRRDGARHHRALPRAVA